MFLGRVPGPDEPYWTEGDREIVAAWTMEKALQCPRCGTRQDEWDQDRQAYVAEGARCLGCEAIETEQEAWRTEGNTRGVSVQLVRPENRIRPRILPEPTS